MIEFVLRNHNVEKRVIFYSGFSYANYVWSIFERNKKFMALIKVFVQRPNVEMQNCVEVVANGHIYHIITNDSNYQINSFTFEVNVTDHHPILCLLDKKKTTYFSKNLTNVFFNAEIFCEILKNDLDFFFNLTLLTNDNFSENFQKFTNIVFSTNDEHATINKTFVTLVETLL